MCLTLSNVDNGVIIYSSSTAPWPHGTNATYQCDEGFSLDGGNDIRTCVGDSNNYIGYWTGTAPNCAGIHVWTITYYSDHALTVYHMIVHVYNESQH